MSFTGDVFTDQTYFERPEQVAVIKVSDEGNVDTFIGVGYREVVICLCCGTIFGVKELEKVGAVYKVLNWVNCDHYITDCRKPFEEKEDSNS